MVSQKNEVEEAIKKMLSHQGTALLEIITDVGLV
jgi:thiamine pyrophosphate-dependent acetolactate synthase large subunit-like protein